MLDTNFNIDENGNPENGLAKLLIRNIDGKTSVIESQNAIATSIKEYLENNLECEGFYTGLIPSGTGTAPDPLIGTYKWGVLNVVLAGALLVASASGGFSSWSISIGTQLKLTIFNPVDETGLITTLPVFLTNLILIIGQNPNATDFRENMNELSKDIINSIIATVPVGGGVGKSPQAVSGSVVYSRFL